MCERSMRRHWTLLGDCETMIRLNKKSEMFLGQRRVTLNAAHSKIL